MADDRTGKRAKFALGVTAPVYKHFQNIDENIVTVAENTIRLCLRNHLEAHIGARASLWSAWGTFIAILLALLTAEFRTFASIEAPVWKAIFLIGCMASGLWCCVTTFRCVRAPNLRDVEENIIAALKTHAEEEERGIQGDAKAQLGQGVSTETTGQANTQEGV